MGRRRAHGRGGGGGGHGGGGHGHGGGGYGWSGWGPYYAEAYPFAPSALDAYGWPVDAHGRPLNVHGADWSEQPPPVAYDEANNPVPVFVAPNPPYPDLRATEAVPFHQQAYRPAGRGGHLHDGHGGAGSGSSGRPAGFAHGGGWAPYPAYFDHIASESPVVPSGSGADPNRAGLVAVPALAGGYFIVDPGD
jgi:hypothetical protein